MHTPPVSPGTHAGVPTRPRASLHGSHGWALFATALAVGFSFGAALPAASAPIEIGNVAAFKRGGTFRSGDKDFTYLADSGNWQAGTENIELDENVTPSFQSHIFLIGHLFDYSSPTTLSLDYQVHINGANGPGWFFQQVSLDSTVDDQTVSVVKEVFTSQDDWAHNLNALTLLSSNGSRDQKPFQPGLTDIWVRDTIVLTDGGHISSASNTFRQTPVPEIDPALFGSSLAVVLGTLSLLERRARRVLGMATAA